MINFSFNVVAHQHTAAAAHVTTHCGPTSLSFPTTRPKASRPRRFTSPDTFTSILWLLSKDQTATLQLKTKKKDHRLDASRVLFPRLHGYTRLNSLRLCRRMVSLTATKTKRMFSVSVAQVKWGYSVFSLSGFCSWYIFRMNSWAEFGSCWGPATVKPPKRRSGSIPPPKPFTDLTLGNVRLKFTSNTLYLDY